MLQNKLEEKISRIITDAQNRVDDELESETTKYNYIKAEAIRSDSSFFRKAVAFIKGERFEIEEHHTNTTNANSLSAEVRNNKDDEARINAARNLFKSSIAHFNEAKNKIESHWNHVINSNTLSSELGYKMLLDNVIVELKTCDRLRVELNKIQDEYAEIQEEYADNMGKIETIKLHNSTVKTGSKNQRGKK